MDNTDKRIRELEKSLKQMKTALAVLVVLVLAGGLMAASGDNVKDVVRCHTLEVVGPDGVPFASIAMAEDGGAGLAILDKNGTMRVGMGYNGEAKGYGLATFGANGKATAGIGDLDNGNRYLGVADNDGNPRAMLGITPDGSASFLVMLDENGKPTHLKPFSAIKKVKEALAPQ